LGFTLRRWVLPFVLGFYPSSLGFTLRRWASPFVVGLHPSSLGFTLRRWASPFIVGLHPSSLGFTLRRWASPFVVVFYALRRLVLPSAVGFNPAGAITFVWFDTKATGAKGAGGFEHPRVVQHEGGFVLVGAKAAVRLVGLGVIVVVS